MPPTPGIRFSSSAIFLSARWKSLGQVRSPVTVRKRIGAVALLNLKSMGCSISPGSSFLAISRASRMSFPASSRSVPQSNLHWTRERLSMDLEVRVSRLLTTLTQFSISLVTSVSTSDAEAPGQLVMMEITGGSMLGNMSMPRRDMEKRPMMKTPRKSMRMATGCLTENSGSFIPCPFRSLCSLCSLWARPRPPRFQRLRHSRA